MTTTYRITTPDGRTVTRKSDAIYSHACVRRDGRVSFHRSYEHAAKAAGRRGHIIAVDTPGARKCTVCDGRGTIRYGPSATDGTFSITTCHRCGGSGHVSDG